MAQAPIYQQLCSLLATSTNAVSVESLANCIRGHVKTDKSASELTEDIGAFVQWCLGTKILVKNSTEYFATEDARELLKNAFTHDTFSYWFREGSDSKALNLGTPSVDVTAPEISTNTAAAPASSPSSVSLHRLSTADQGENKRKRIVEEKDKKEKLDREKEERDERQTAERERKEKLQKEQEEREQEEKRERARTKREKELEEQLQKEKEARRLEVKREEEEARARMDSGHYRDIGDMCVYVINARSGAKLAAGPDNVSVLTTAVAEKRFTRDQTLWRITQGNGYVILRSLSSGLNLGCSPTGMVKLRDGPVGIQWRVETALGDDKYNRFLTAIAYDRRLMSHPDGAIGTTTGRDIAERWRIEVTDIRSPESGGNAQSGNADNSNYAGKNDNGYKDKDGSRDRDGGAESNERDRRASPGKVTVKTGSAANQKAAAGCCVIQ